MTTGSASDPGRPAAAGRFTHEIACPRCGGYVYSVRRRLVDLLAFVVTPVRRYCCRSIACGWEGNLRRVSHAGSVPARGDSYEELRGLLERPRAVPKAKKKDHPDAAPQRPRRP